MSFLVTITDIVHKTGAKSESKIKQMRRTIRNGGKLPPIRLAFIDDTLRERLGRMGLDTIGKVFFLLEGHHRCRAMELEKKDMIAAKVVHKIY
jgi:hypothetical protein